MHAAQEYKYVLYLSLLPVRSSLHSLPHQTSSTFRFRVDMPRTSTEVTRKGALATNSYRMIKRVRATGMLYRRQLPRRAANQNRRVRPLMGSLCLAEGLEALRRFLWI